MMAVPPFKTMSRNRQVARAARLWTLGAFICHVAGRPVAKAEPPIRPQVSYTAKRRGAGMEVTFKEFTQATSAYRSRLVRGGTVPLGGALEQYKEYLAEFHSHLHGEFAVRFIGSLEERLNTMDDLSLVTKLEIVIESDGWLHSIGIIESSGNAQYDFEAFSAVHRGAPYPPPPSSIHSPDGRTYLRWSLHRNESQCGSWNAEPYMLSEAAVREKVLVDDQARCRSSHRCPR